MNKYLEKIAKEAEKKKPSLLRTGVQVGAGAALAKSVPSHLLGYHTVYHGTSSRVGQKIRKEGFDPAYGGSGAGAHSGNEDFVRQSKGKVHVTKGKGTARFFAGYAEHAEKMGPLKTPPGNNPFANLDHIIAKAKRHQQLSIEGVKNMVTGKHGDVIKSRISDMSWNKDFVADPHMGSGRNKDLAATTTKKIGTQSIGRQRRWFANKMHLSRYYGSTEGKIRAAKGVAKGVLGAGLIGTAIYDRIKKHDK